MDFHEVPQGYLHSSTLCHGLVASDLAKWPKLASVQTYPFTVGIFLTCDSFTDREVAIPGLLAHLRSYDWVVNEAKMKGTGL